MISPRFSFFLLLLTGVFAFTSCSLNFPEDPEDDGPAKNSSSSNIIVDNSSSSGYQGESSSSFSSSSGSEPNSSSSSKPEDGVQSSSSSAPPEISSSSGEISSSSSSAPPTSSSGCTASENTQTHYCSSGVMKEYGSVNYEGKTYKTVVIGTQTWMAENLNYNPQKGYSKCYGEGGGNGADEWLLPEAAQVNCEKYGRLYDWATAMNLSAGCNTSSCGDQVLANNNRGICPEGWHIPTIEEWNTLRDLIEQEIFDNYEDIDFGWDVGTKLKAISGWKESNVTDYGVDGYGFAAIASGYCVNCESLSDGSGYYAGCNKDLNGDTREEAHWWSSSEFVNPFNDDPNDVKEAYKSKITYSKKVMTQEREDKGDHLYSIRCMMD